MRNKWVHATVILALLLMLMPRVSGIVGAWGPGDTKPTRNISKMTTAPSGSITLNNGAGTTPSVLVHLDASVSGSISGVEMRLRNADDSWGNWQPFTSHTLWQLPGVTGQDYTVEAQFREGVGNESPVYQQSITLDIYPDRPASTNYRLFKSTLGASAQKGTSTQHRLQGTLGQPSMIGWISSSRYQLASGYWAAQRRDYGLYLPLILRDYISYFEGPWEAEPNNSYLAANGPLRSGQDYYGYPNDQKDYFSIYLRTGGQIAIDLTNHTGQGVQLQLFYQSVANRVAHDLNAPYHIDYTGSAGWYYVYIYTESGHNSDTSYTLRVTYP